MNKEHKNRSGIIMIAIFILFIAFFSAGNILLKNKDFSENENRYLQELPKMSARDITDGTFEKNMESYVSDRLTGREFLIGAKSNLLHALGICEVNGVYLCKDNYYIEKKTDMDVDPSVYQKNLSAFQKYYAALASNGFEKNKLCMMMVPTASAILRDKMPENAPYFDEFKVLSLTKKMLNDFNVIDVQNAIGNGEHVFYRTDHHWTTGSAYAAYVKWCEWTGRDAHDASFYDVITASDQFRGTLYSKVLALDAPYDKIEYYIPHETVETEIVCDGRQMKFTDGFYDKSFLEKKDKYASFLGGNYGEVKISTGKETGSSILILKDSYANCFIPFLYDYFDQIYMIDLRYYNGDISNYAQEHGVTEILALYNISSFVSDKTIGKVGLK